MSLHPGDVLEIACEEGYAYLVYIGRHERLGDAVLVIRTVFPDRQRDAEALTRSPAYIIFYPAASAVRARLVKRIGRSETGIPPVPVWVRSAVNVEHDGRVRSWLVTDGKERIPRRSLSEAETQLPIASIWNHPLLLERLKTGWSPDDGHLGLR